MTYLFNFKELSQEDLNSEFAESLPPVSPISALPFQHHLQSIPLPNQSTISEDPSSNQALSRHPSIMAYPFKTNSQA